MKNFNLLKDSPIFYNHPQFADESLNELDIIRYNFELLEDYYENLFDNLDNLINKKLGASVKNNFVLVNYGWLIVEHASRFKNIVERLFPNYNFKTSDIWDKIRLIRNTNQHIEERFELFEKKNESYFGYLTVYFLELGTNKRSVFLSTIGLANRNLKFEATKPLENTALFYKNMQSVTLNSIGRDGHSYMVDLLILFNEIKEFKDYYEKQIIKTMEENNLEAFDWKGKRDLCIIITAQD